MLYKGNFSSADQNLLINMRKTLSIMTSLDMFRFKIHPAVLLNLEVHRTMELKFWFMCFIVICSCIAYEAKRPDSKTSKSKITKRLKAVENLVRSEFHFVHENLKVGRVERELLREKLNETLELLDISKIETDIAERAKLMKTLNDTLELLDEKIERVANEKFERDKTKREKLTRKLNKALNLLDMSEVNEKIEAGKEEREKLWKTLNDTLKRLLVNTSLVITGRQEYGKVKESDIEMLTMKIEKNDDTFEELSEGLLRIERGFMEEKKSRKGDINAMYTILTDILQNQTGMTENHENMVRVLSDLDNVTHALIIKSDLLEQKLDALRKEINSLGKTKVQVKLDNKTFGLTPESSTSNAVKEISTETSVRRETVISKQAQE